MLCVARKVDEKVVKFVKNPKDLHQNKHEQDWVISLKQIKAQAGPRSQINKYCGPPAYPSKFLLCYRVTWV